MHPDSMKSQSRESPPAEVPSCQMLKITSYRLKRELECQERWPMYALYAEDSTFWNKEWNNHFDPKNTDLVLWCMIRQMYSYQAAPSSGDLNRALHNVYYNMCCAKGGVAVQLCNWVFRLPLITGHCDDDQQIKYTMILEMQKVFAEQDPISLKAFLNVFDKGYHRLLEAKQLARTVVLSARQSWLTLAWGSSVAYGMCSIDSIGKWKRSEKSQAFLVR
jgi:hypothetical protein